METFEIIKDKYAVINIFNFNIIFYDEKEMLDKGHSGKPEPHRHNVVEMIAQKTC